MKESGEGRPGERGASSCHMGSGGIIESLPTLPLTGTVSGLPEEGAGTPRRNSSWLHGAVRESHTLPSPGPKITSLWACHLDWNARHCHRAFELGHCVSRVPLLNKKGVILER